MPDSINDLIFTKLGAVGFTGSVTDRLHAWKEANSLTSFQAYQTYIFTNTIAENFSDAEYEFWYGFVV